MTSTPGYYHSENAFPVWTEAQAVFVFHFTLERGRMLPNKYITAFVCTFLVTFIVGG